MDSNKAVMTQYKEKRSLYRLNGEGGAKVLEGSLEPNAEGAYWMHLGSISEKKLKQHLKKDSDLGPLVVDALTAKQTRPRFALFENGLLLIFRGLNFNDGAEPEDMVSIRIWVEKDRIISVQRRAVKAVDDLVLRLNEGIGPKSISDFLSHFCELLFEPMDPVLDALEDETDRIEAELLKDPNIDNRKVLSEIRKDAVVLKRYLSSQKDIMKQLHLSDLDWLEPVHKHQIRELYDRLCRYVEDLDEIKERSQIIKDDLSNNLYEKVNKNTYFLSIITAIFLPLGFLTGLLGINVMGIPGSDNPHAFWITVCFLSVIALSQLLIFRRLKWF